MSALPTAMRLARDGTVTIEFADGTVISDRIDAPSFAATSMIDSSTYYPVEHRLRMSTVLGDEILVELPRPDDLAPVRDRSSIYLDQNHWSTLAKTIHDPARVPNADERAAAEQLIDLVMTKQIILPMSSGHMAETCKQVDPEQRYQRALTIAQLSGGWQFLDPLAIREHELRQALAARYLDRTHNPVVAVTLEPNAVHAGRDGETHEVDRSLPPDGQWALHCIRHISGSLDAMLDAEHEPMSLAAASGWASGLQDLATYLRENPTGPEIKRRRTHGRFITDLGMELARAVAYTGITSEQISDWLKNHSENDVASMPSLGLFREVLHEKLVDGNRRWDANDLIDMMYLTSGAGYCDHIVGERAHSALISNGAQRLGRTLKIHRTLRSLIQHL